MDVRELQTGTQSFTHSVSHANCEMNEMRGPPDILRFSYTTQQALPTL